MQSIFMPPSAMKMANYQRLGHFPVTYKLSDCANRSMFGPQLSHYKAQGIDRTNKLQPIKSQI